MRESRYPRSNIPPSEGNRMRGAVPASLRVDPGPWLTTDVRMRESRYPRSNIPPSEGNRIRGAVPASLRADAGPCLTTDVRIGRPFAGSGWW
jgi:hypothetical protein